MKAGLRSKQVKFSVSCGASAGLSNAGLREDLSGVTLTTDLASACHFQIVCRVHNRRRGFPAFLRSIPLPPRIFGEIRDTDVGQFIGPQ